MTPVTNGNISHGNRSWRRRAILVLVAALALFIAAGAFWISTRRSYEGTGLDVRIADLKPADPDPAEQTVAAPSQSPQRKQHPLDRPLEIARNGLEHIRNDIHDYTAVMVKRERVGNDFIGPEKMFLKIRNRKTDEGKLIVPLSVYMKFLEPPSKAGREVIWVEDRNDGKLVGHEAGLLNLMRANLNPNGPFAMMGNRYPISEIGIENLVQRLIEKGQRDRSLEPCDVQIRAATVEGRQCTLIEVKHPERRPYFDFHIARIFIDDELNIPIRYAAYSWPEADGGEPVLLEEYTYLDVRLNVGLSDADFDPDNPDYDFP
jgi:hypothetical protein